MKKFTDKLNESVEDKIPTAEDFIDKEYYHIKLDLNKTDSYINISDIYYAMIEFAKIHVEACKKEISESTFKSSTGHGNVYHTESAKDSILNAYPLENIK